MNSEPETVACPDLVLIEEGLRWSLAAELLEAQGLGSDILHLEYLAKESKRRYIKRYLYRAVYQSRRRKVEPRWGWKVTGVCRMNQQNHPNSTIWENITDRQSRMPSWNLGVCELQSLESKHYYALERRLCSAPYTVESLLDSERNVTITDNLGSWALL